MTKSKTIKFCILILLLFCSLEYVFAQLPQPPKIVRNNSCESNAAWLDSIKSGFQEGSFIIAIARLGNSEGSVKYNLMRLDVIKRFFEQSGYSKMILVAQGEKSKGRGRVEIYINGMPKLIFELPRRQNLKAGNCGY